MTFRKPHPIQRITIGLAILGALPMVLAPVWAAELELSPDPRAWRPLVQTDLRLRGPGNAVYADLWADLIARNNDAARVGISSRPILGNTPVSEAHFVVRNTETVALLSVLNAHTLCKPVSSGVIRCPLRLTIYRGGSSSVREGTGCLPLIAVSGTTPGNMSSGTGAYASYDVATRSIRYGVLIDHEAIDGCSQTLPINEAKP